MGTSATDVGVRVRYETLVALISNLNRATSMVGAAKTLVADIKYVLRLNAWRFVLACDDVAIVLGGNLHEVSIETFPKHELSPIERRALEASVPWTMHRERLRDAREELPQALRGDLDEIFVLPAPGPDGRSDYAFFIGVSGAPISELDMKFAILTAQLLSDKVKQLWAEMRQREAEAARRDAALRLTEAYRVLAERDQRLQRDLEQARAFQQRMLPKLPTSTLIRLCAVYSPAEMVGGDIYDVCEIAPGRLRIFIADASGHGVQASLRTMVLKTEYDRIKRIHEMPAELLMELNEKIVKEFKDMEMRCSACCFDVDTAAGDPATIIYANAAHVPVMHIRVNGDVDELYVPGPYLGGFPSVQLKNIRVSFDRGERLMAYTDGLCEQPNKAGEEYGWDRVSQIVSAASNVEEAISHLLRSVVEFGGSLNDDVTMVAIEHAPREIS